MMGSENNLLGTFLIKLKLTPTESPLSKDEYRKFAKSVAEDSGYVVFEKAAAILLRKEGYEYRFSREGTNILVESESVDQHLIWNMRHLAIGYGQWVSDMHLRLRLPGSPNVIPFTYLSPPPRLKPILASSPFTPFFYMYATASLEQVVAVYLRKEDGTIHIANTGMLNLFTSKQFYQADDQFTYQVATSGDDFSAKMNHGLIPADFYRYQSQNLKIINLSSFDIQNIHRKVFFRPHVYRLGSFKDLNKLPGGGNLADKVRPQETLDQAIRRVLREELKLADDYVGAVVQPSVEFDLDRDNKLTPRLVINVVIKDESLSKSAEEKTRRGWRSLDSNKD